MKTLEGKKIMFLGASTYFYDAAKYAKSMGAYLIAVDYHPKEIAVAKYLADEEYMISTTDVEAIYKLAKEKKVDGIYAGASEVNIPIAIEVSERLNLPKYCTKEQWKICTNKRMFKEICKKYDIPITKEYHLKNLDEEEIEKIQFPVVTKPVDNNGSTGISICQNKEEFVTGYKKAMQNSKSGDILIEKFMPYENSMILHYTAQDGEIIFSGISDKQSKKIKEDAAPVMSVQFFPSKYEQLYLDKTNAKVKQMLKGMGVKNGAIWIESFFEGDEFILNEIGYRFGGSLTYYPIEYFSGINQMNLIIYYAATGENLYDDFKDRINNSHKSAYCILPIQIKTGIIEKIAGVEEMKKLEGVYAFIQSHVEKDVIRDTGTTLQVFGYIHLVGKTKKDIENTIDQIMNTLKAYDKDGNNMLYTLYRRGK